METTFMDDAEEASLSVDAICEMAAVINETYGKIMRIPKHLYGEKDQRNRPHDHFQAQILCNS